MAKVTESDSFKEFMRQNGDGKLKVMAQDGYSKTETEPDNVVGKLVLESSNGRRLTAIYDADLDTYKVQNEPKDAKEPLQLSILNGKDRLEFDPKGQVTEVKDGQVTWTKPAHDLEEGSGNLKKGVDTLQDTSNSVGWMAKSLSNGNTGPVARIAHQLGDGKWSGRIGVGAGSGSAALSSLSLAADIANGDWNRVTEKGAGLATDVAELVQTLESRAGAAAGGAGASAARFGWVSNGARILGGAGVLTGVALTTKDLVDKKYTRAALGAAGVAGGGYALLGTASFAGPLGWGVAGAAGLATMAWDFNEGTQLAPFEL
jgi:hypothetical protein